MTPTLHHGDCGEVMLISEMPTDDLIQAVHFTSALFGASLVSSLRGELRKRAKEVDPALDDTDAGPLKPKAMAFQAHRLLSRELP